jgi:hypothetical protein
VEATINPGPAEEAAKVAGGVTEALKAQPLALALIVLNVIWLVAVFWTAHSNSVREDALLADLVRSCSALK